MMEKFEKHFIDIYNAFSSFMLEEVPPKIPDIIIYLILYNILLYILALLASNDSIFEKAAINAILINIIIIVILFFIQLFLINMWLPLFAVFVIKVIIDNWGSWLKGPWDF